MTWKRSAADNRTSFPRAADYTRKFVKDWDRLSASGRFNMRQLKAVMLLLISNDEPLPLEWLDHQLSGEWADHRECHVGGDFLLIYQLDGKGAGSIVQFVRAGTHADLFD
ncbi:MAG TPA: type II toxin-antitoxin system YafQ family toxin [Rhodospirillaceae bacterium]|nr:type II toxin-antitoxin system YafQ family toxin [Rhodospirillaceae bacterium]